MEAEEMNAITLAETVANTQKAIFETREDMAQHGGVKAALENAKAVQKQIRVLENRLDKALQKFNQAIEANRVLREQIDTLRRERVVFDNIYKKLENELQSKKKEMANIIEQANAAYEARDSAQAQMASLKQQADKEHAEFEKEWRELGKLIENDKKMKEFMRTKVKATGVCDIDELVQNFIHAEDQNFSLFKYNNELSVDIEKLDQQIAEYREEYVALSGNGSRKEDTEKVKILETLEEKWNDIDRKAIHYEVKYQESQQTLTHVRTGIETIFKRLGCSVDDLPSGCGTGISETNMLQYLALIEGRSNELLKLYDALKQDDEDYEGIVRPAAKGGSSALHAPKLPSTVEDYDEDDEDDDDDDQRPFFCRRNLRSQQTNRECSGGIEGLRN